MKRKGFKEILLLLSMLFALTGCSVSEATQHGMAVDTIQTEDVLLRVDFLNVLLLRGAFLPIILF